MAAWPLIKIPTDYSNAKTCSERVNETRPVKILFNFIFCRWENLQ